MTRAGAAPTEARTVSRPEVRTGTLGKARPSSSAVRRAPTTLARSRNPPHSWQLQSAAGRPHQPQAGVPPSSRTSRGPAQDAHLAGSRQRSQASRGT